MDFHGYPAPISNYTYTPNQFFDVVLRHFSRGAVRICGYMIRQALGWCGPDGEPSEGQIVLSQEIASARANVSKESVGPALRELIEGRVIECVREPVRAAAGRRGGIPGLYALRWDSTGEYTHSADDFNGFYDDGNSGCMTRVPDLFFDYTLLHEPLSVVRVVGCILRSTIGYQAGRGVRRIQAQLSQRQIMEKTGITSAGLLTEALSTARKHNHIIETPGFFDKNGGQESRAAVYSILWEDNWGGSLQTARPDRHRKTGADSPENRSGDESHRNFGADLPEKQSGRHRKSGAGSSSENRSDIEITPFSQTTPNQKQQQPDTAAVSALRSVGYDDAAALSIAGTYPAEVILRQVEYFPYRSASRNPLGMLRSAIEGDWSAPATYTTAAAERSRHAQEEDARRRARHQREHEGAYTSYIDSSLREIENSDPEAWYLFNESLDAQIDATLSSPVFAKDPEMAERMRSRLRAPEAIRDHALRYFPDRILGFWEWDRDVNRDSYK